jgi:hypothetical protein
MIVRTDLSRLSPQEKANLVYSQARAEAVSRLWRAALGDPDRDSTMLQTASAAPSSLGLDQMLSLLGKTRPAPAAPAPAALDPAAAPQVAETEPAALAGGGAGGLGANAVHLPSLERAAARTGIPANALAAIVNAEAAKGKGGRWQTMSRNPRSSAAGLGQFLSGTWIGEAQRSGTYLNEVARTRGWLDGSGKLLSGCRSALLALRYDADTSINAIADYAKGNLDRLRRAGVQIGGSAEKIAQSAYLGHHLGPGDAIRFMKGGLDPARARTLLNAQVGATKASQRIAATGDATAAHRSWLLDYVGRHIQPAKFSAA